MVLEKLGDSLKQTLAKITKATFVDEKLINELVKDIQRALLQSDVNVQLVMKLSTAIKDRAMKEKPPGGMSRKEWLIKIVYEELVQFLGGPGGKITLDKKPFIIMLVGLFGNGKCVHKDTNVLLWDGLSLSAKDLYDKYKSDELLLEDGTVSEPAEPLYVPSFNPHTCTIERKRVTHLWKLNGKDLMKVSLRNGNDFSVRTTPEHPFFVLDNCSVTQKRADQLKIGDFVSVPNVCRSEGKQYSFSHILKQMNADILVAQEEAKAVRNLLKTQYGTLKNSIESFPYSRNFCTFTSNLKSNRVPIWLFEDLPSKVLIRTSGSQVPIHFPTSLNSELAELLGYVLGDGYLSKQGLHISTADEEVMERVSHLSQSLFSIRTTFTQDKRSKAIHLRISSKTLAEIFHMCFGLPFGRKGRNLSVPSCVQTARQDVLASFISAYFDCDGHFSPKQRQIELITESKTLAKQIQHLLLRFNILGSLRSKQIHETEYYALNIEAEYAVRFACHFNPIIARKKLSLRQYIYMSDKQGAGYQDMIPVGSVLKKLRRNDGYSINQIQTHASSYGLYESKGWISKQQLRKVVAFYDSGESPNFKQYLSQVAKRSFHESRPRLNAFQGELQYRGLVDVTSGGVILTQEGRSSLKQQPTNVLESIRILSQADVCWVPVTKVESIENEHGYVYDLTVEDNHSFIADGIVVHNTTTAGKLALFFKKRGQKVAVITTDTWRPAAYDQLQQLAKQVGIDFYGNKKEKKPEKIYKEYEKELKKYDIVIVDTAGRDALNDELVKELNAIDKAVNAHEKLLVMSADIGQAAEKQAQTFHDTVHVTGVVTTKLDGTAKGGGALIACAVTGAPVKFIGVGEKVDDLEEFKPEGFVGRLLGMGDMEALLEKAKHAITEDEAQDLGKKLLKGEFNLLDLYEQMNAMKKMGSLSKIMEMVPGMGQLNISKDQLSVQEEKLKKWKYIMNSMTKEELEEPDKISVQR
ncbi:MAG: LAGLIDADG family homing endonuclease, partial [Candidatus Woesearchaeota archaeon]